MGCVTGLCSSGHTPAPLKRGIYKIQRGRVVVHDQFGFYGINSPLERGRGCVIGLCSSGHTPAPLKRGIYKIQRGRVVVSDQWRIGIRYSEKSGFSEYTKNFVCLLIQKISDEKRPEMYGRGSDHPADSYPESAEGNHCKIQI